MRPVIQEAAMLIIAALNDLPLQAAHVAVQCRGHTSLVSFAVVVLVIAHLEIEASGGTGYSWEWTPATHVGRRTACV